MAGGRLLWPLIEPVLNATGQVVAGAVLTVYQNRTANLATVYADEALTTPVANPQNGIYASNAAGRFFTQTKAFWLTAGSLYTYRVDRPDGTFDVIDDISPQGGEFDDVTVAIAGSQSIEGLRLSNAAGFVTTRVSVSSGECRSSLNTADLRLATPMTKRIDQAWAVGTNSGGRDTGTLGASQTWHVFIITKPDGADADILFSQSATLPSLPASYSLFRRLGAFLTDATNAIREFVQFDDVFKLKIRSTDFAAQANGAGPYLRQISVPNGVKVEAELYFQTTGTANASVFHSGIYDPDFGVPPAFGASTQWAQVRRFGLMSSSSSPVSYETRIVRQTTDANRQVYTYSNDASDVIVLGVIGWRDVRALG